MEWCRQDAVISLCPNYSTNKWIDCYADAATVMQFINIKLQESHVILI